MKIIKTASGKRTLKLSKKDWEDIGKKAGWMKKADRSNWTEEDWSDWNLEMKMDAGEEAPEKPYGSTTGNTDEELYYVDPITGEEVEFKLDVNYHASWDWSYDIPNSDRGSSLEIQYAELKSPVTFGGKTYPVKTSIYDILGIPDSKEKIDDRLETYIYNSNEDGSS